MSNLTRPWHVLAVQSATEISAYFQEKLGFEEFRAVGENDWRFLRRGECVVMLGTCEGEVLARETGNHSYFAYWHTEEGIDELFAEWKEKGAILSSSPASKPWGMREFGVQTPEGHRITVGQEIQ